MHRSFFLLFDIRFGAASLILWLIDLVSGDLISQKLTVAFEMALVITELIDHDGLITIAASSSKFNTLVIDEMIFNSVRRKLLTTPNRAWLFYVLAILQHVLDVIMIFVTQLLFITHFILRFQFLVAVRELR